MKYVLIITLSMMVSHYSRAQVVNGTPLEHLDALYIKISCSGQHIMIDYGQKRAGFNGLKNTLIKDKFGKKMRFNSIMEVINMMAQLGYNLKDCGLREKNTESDDLFYLMEKVK